MFNLYFISGSTSQTILIGFLCICVIRYIQYHWNRRKLYQSANQRRGPLCLPFIGSAFYFFGSDNNILKTFQSIVKKFEAPLPLWLGNRLYFVLSDPQDFDNIFNSPHALEKDDVYKFARFIAGTGLFTAPVPKWKRNRKIIQPAFSQKNLDQFVEVFVEKSEILLKQLEREVGKGSFDIFYYISRCNVDIICETAFGLSIDAQTTDSALHNWIDKGMEIVYKRMFNVLYHFDFIFNLSQLSKELEDILTDGIPYMNSIFKKTKEAYQNRKRIAELESLDKEETFKRTNFLQLLLELTENDERFTDKDLQDEVFTFIIAGSDTSASVNSFIFMILGMFPDVQQKLYEEIIDVLGTDRPVEPKDLGNFKYMEMVFKETMRVFPLAPLVIRYVSEDIKLDKITVPCGSSVILYMFGVHRNSDIYSDPIKFDPNRFLPEEIAKRSPYSWVPFAAGSRNCIGMKYAYMAMKSLTATVLRKYKFSTEYKNIEDVELKAELLLKPVNGYKVSIELRE